MITSTLRWFHAMKYFLIYYIIGGIAILEDLFHKRSNKVALRNQPKYVAIVTGGSRGIGRSVVQKLMECEMHVVIGCINVQNGESTVEEIRSNGVTKGSVSVLELDLKSLKSVRKFASTFLKRHDYLNILVNNAGVMFGPYEESEDGFESQFAVNYLGHFLLTQILLPAMKRASTMFDSNPRIINVSSCAHEVSPKINFEDINMKKMYIEHAAYAQSKLCLLMFSLTMHRHLKSIQSNIQSIALHPGIVNTELFNGTLVKLLTPWVLSIFSKTPEQGATTIVYCCVDEETENAGGSYFSNCKRVSYLKYADDIAIQDRLYNFSMDAVRPFLLQT